MKFIFIFIKTNSYQSHVFSDQILLSNSFFDHIHVKFTRLSMLKVYEFMF